MGLQLRDKMKLRQHIDQNHKGNIAEFCRAAGVSHTQALRWLDYGCIWLDGQVWKQQSKIETETDKFNKAAKVFDDLND